MATLTLATLSRAAYLGQLLTRVQAANAALANGGNVTFFSVTDANGNTTDIPVSPPVTALNTAIETLLTEAVTVLQNDLAAIGAPTS